MNVTVTDPWYTIAPLRGERVVETRVRGDGREHALASEQGQA